LDEKSHLSNDRQISEILFGGKIFILKKQEDEDGKRKDPRKKRRIRDYVL